MAETAKPLTEIPFGGRPGTLAMTTNVPAGAFPIFRIVTDRAEMSEGAAAVEFPETYLAVRDAIDAAIRSQQNTAG